MEEKLYHGFKRVDFDFKGREAILVFPDNENRTNKWLFKTEYFDAFPDLEIEMLKRGWHLAYIKNIHRWCCDDDLILKLEFMEFLKNEYKLDEKCVPVGMSCGGMFAIKLAALCPQKIHCLYLDAPVINLLSCPAGMGDSSDILWNEFNEVTGITRSQLLSYREHPLDKISVLIDNNIPVILVYGKKDDVVLYKENGALLESIYKKNGGIINVICKENCNHHPHGLEDSSVIVNFIISHSV